jgi:hypothetical protein
MALTGYWLLIPGWRGYLLAWFSLVAVANVCMSAYNRLRVEIHKERSEARQIESATDDRGERAA